MSAITVDGDLIHYEKLGRGRPIILIHGWVGSWRYWIPLMQQLHLRYKVYTLDLPGFGDSSKNSEHYNIQYQVKLLERFMERLGISKAAFIGHGLGALVLTEFAFQNQDKVARLLLISAPIFDPGDLADRNPAGQRTLLTPPKTSAQTIASDTQSDHDLATDAGSGRVPEETLMRRPDGLTVTTGSPIIPGAMPESSSPTAMNPSSIDRNVLLERAREREAQRLASSGNNPLSTLFAGKTILNLLDKAIKRSEDVYTKLKPDVEKADDAVLNESAKGYDSGKMLDHLRLIKGDKKSPILTLIVHGEDDPIIPKPDDPVWDYLTVNKDELAPILLPGVRHFPMLEHDAFPRLATDFLEVDDLSKLELRERWRRRSR
ncbi:MAG: alpha/beta fold hydrolase [Aggregatilineales bacterium]